MNGRWNVPTVVAIAVAVALEGGFKWRFTIPGINLFAGARVGLRAIDLTHFRYPRLIIEIGGGSW